MKHKGEQFHRDLPDDDVCLEYIFGERFGLDLECGCNGESEFKRIFGRKGYFCPSCGKQIFPLGGTIFERTHADLVSWFHAIFLLGTSGYNLTVRKLAKELKVTVKCACRMKRLITKFVLSQQVKPSHNRCWEQLNKYLRNLTTSDF